MQPYFCQRRLSPWLWPKVQYLHMAEAPSTYLCWEISVMSVCRSSGQSQGREIRKSHACMPCLLWMLMDLLYEVMRCLFQTGQPLVCVTFMGL